MSTKLPAVNVRDITRILEKKGFVLVRQSGSHAIFRHANGKRTTVPIHSSKDLGKGLLSQIMKDAGISNEELRKFI